MNNPLPDEIRFEVMRLFLTSKDNRIDTIAGQLDISRISVSKIIERYYKNGGLIIESSMNKPEEPERLELKTAS